MAQKELDRLERELLDYFYFGDAILLTKMTEQKERMKEYRNRRIKCYMCDLELKRSHLYYHLKKIHHTTAKNYLKNK